jgi:serine/threonine protein kinase
VQGHWEIDLNELQIAAIGLVNSSGQYVQMVNGMWRNNHVLVTVYQLLDIPDVVLEELAQDAAASSAHNHPHIAKFLGTCVVNGSIYLVNEHVRGGTLKDFLVSSSKPLK